MKRPVGVAVVEDEPQALVEVERRDEQRERAGAINHTQPLKMRPLIKSQATTASIACVSLLHETGLLEPPGCPFSQHFIVKNPEYPRGIGG